MLDGGSDAVADFSTGDTGQQKKEADDNFTDGHDEAVAASEVEFET